MKKYLSKITALALLLIIIGCQKEPGKGATSTNKLVEVNVLLDDMDIATSNLKTTTKSIVNDVVDFDTYGFSIAGYYTEKNASIAENKGLFYQNIEGLMPNLFNRAEGGGIDMGKDGVLVVTKRTVADGSKPADNKFHVELSKMTLKEDSYLSYVAWATNANPATTTTYPIKSATTTTNKGLPFIEIATDGHIDVVAAKSIDNSNNLIKNTIDFNFKHVLSKLKFKATNSAGKLVTITSVKIKFLEGKIARRAKYIFEDIISAPGQWDKNTFADKEAIVYPVPLSVAIEATAASTDLHEMLIIPQSIEKGDISIELSYSITNEAEGKYTRTIELDAQTFVQNASYTYEFIIRESQIDIKGQIGNWKGTGNYGLPNIAGPCDGKTLLLLDAYDAPYTHTDNNKYWLDRSGYNRHCKMVGSVPYNKTDKCYSFSNGNNTYFEVPPFPETTAASIDMVVRGYGIRGGPQQTVFNFVAGVSGTERIMFTHFGLDNRIYFDAAGFKSGMAYARIFTLKITEAMINKVAMYSFSKSLTQQKIFRNLTFTTSESLDQSAGGHSIINLADATIRQIGINSRVDIKYFRVSNTERQSITEPEYRVLAKRHKIPD